MTDVLFPRLSEKQPDAEGVLATWLVATGDHVAAGQLIGEVMVDKVAADVFASATGRIELLVAEEQVVRQGEAIARVD
jgi:pyruvate/2-oxoglutarate dehydrogenase complex dihydrolipoamide acyltransferase (E2) component